MKAFNKILLTVIALIVVIFIAANVVIINDKDDTSGRPYIVEASRVALELEEKSINDIDLSKYDYIADAVDTVSAKLEIIERAYKLHIPVISAMGAGNKTHPELFEVADINDTSVCPLARVMRRELKSRGIKKLKVVYSKEEPKKSGVIDPESGKTVPGSLSFVPSVMGLIMAGEILNDIVKSIEK